MNFIKNLFRAINLQIMAEGGDGGEGATGDTGTAAEYQTGDTQQAAAAETPVDRDAEFEKLIKGDYREQYTKRLQDTLSKRMKGVSEKAAKYDKAASVFDALAQRYGVDASDMDALINAVNGDDYYVEKYADEHNISNDTAREILNMKRQNDAMKSQIDEANKRRKFDALWSQGEELKKTFPTFDLIAEMQNPEFTAMLDANVPVDRAYKAIHSDEILSGAMEYTAKTVESKLASKMAAGKARPSENGSKSASATMAVDVSKLTKAQMDDYIARAARGERITFRN